MHGRARRIRASPPDYGAKSVVGSVEVVGGATQKDLDAKCRNRGTGFGFEGFSGGDGGFRGWGLGFA